mgnify:CR=1 FL=1
MRIINFTHHLKVIRNKFNNNPVLLKRRMIKKKSFKIKSIYLNHILENLRPKCHHLQQQIYKSILCLLIISTCSPSMLLRSLSNPSMAPSPARKLEIKVNLNKLIQR